VGLVKAQVGVRVDAADAAAGSVLRRRGRARARGVAARGRIGFGAELPVDHVPRAHSGDDDVAGLLSTGARTEPARLERVLVLAPCAGQRGVVLHHGVDAVAVLEVAGGDRAARYGRAPFAARGLGEPRLAGRFEGAELAGSATPDAAIEVLRRRVGVRADAELRRLQPGGLRAHRTHLPESGTPLREAA